MRDPMARLEPRLGAADFKDSLSDRSFESPEKVGSRFRADDSQMKVPWVSAV